MTPTFIPFCTYIPRVTSGVKMPVASLVMLASRSIQTGDSTSAGAPGSILRSRITDRQPLTRASTSLGSVVPACPASTVIDGLPRVVAVFSR